MTRGVPDGYHTLNSYLAVKGAAAALEFYAKAFGAKELYRLTGPGGQIGHAEMTIGDSKLMLADEFPEYEVYGPQKLGGSPVTLSLYVEDVDALVAQATAAGATVMQPVADQFYGDRTGKLRDPFGHIWHIATRKEDVSPEEMQRRFDEWMKSQG